MPRFVCFGAQMMSRYRQSYGGDCVLRVACRVVSQRSESIACRRQPLSVCLSFVLIVRGRGCVHGRTTCIHRTTSTHRTTKRGASRATLSQLLQCSGISNSSTPDARTSGCVKPCPGTSVLSSASKRELRLLAERSLLERPARACWRGSRQCSIKDPVRRAI